MRKKQRSKSKSQKERFIETARSIGADETGIEFERAFTIIVSPKNKKRSEKEKTQNKN